MAEPAELILAEPGATQDLGALLAHSVTACGILALTIYLEGDLGAGKTTLARGFLRALGHAGRVPSPTYTLIEPYELSGCRLYHVDLYRIRDPAELDDLGLRDLLAGAAVVLVEWPDHGAGHLPAPDLVIRLRTAGHGRAVSCEAMSPAGRAVLARAGIPAAAPQP